MNIYVGVYAHCINLKEQQNIRGFLVQIPVHIFHLESLNINQMNVMILVTRFILKGNQKSIELFLNI